MRATDGIQKFMIGAFILMAACLLFSIPPGASPDEGAHYLRALGAGRGQLILEDIPARPPTSRPDIDWLVSQSKQVHLPERLATTSFECWAEPHYVGTCRENEASDGEEVTVAETYVGTYPPFSYLPSGLLMRPAGDAISALMLGRFGILLISVMLIGAAVLALHQRGGRLWLLGMICCVTPMVLVLAATLSSSGVETSAGICFMACLLRLSRTGGPRWVWVTAALSGAILAAVRELGPAWVLLNLVLIVTLSGFGRVKSSWKSGGRAAWILPGALLAGVVASVAWQAVEAVRPDLSRMRPPSLGIGEIGGLARQVVGVFGPLDTLMPDVAYRLWGTMVIVLVAAAFFSGHIRQRVALLLSILATGVVTLALESVQNVHSFEVQARHVLPAVVTIILLAGEIVARGPRPGWMNSRLVMPAFALAAAAVHMTAWYTIGRRFPPAQMHHSISSTPRSGPHREAGRSGAH